MDSLQEKTKHTIPWSIGTLDMRGESNYPPNFRINPIECYHFQRPSPIFPVCVLTPREGSESHFDWFKSYSDLAGLIHELIPNKSSKILMLGCGNSKLSEEMWEDGYKNIVNTDYSAVVIEKMQARHGACRPEMTWLEMDVRNLQFDDSSFDVAIDKGTMDAMLAVKGDVWNPPEEVIENCTREVDETLRVLRKNGGVFIYLTFGQPHFRRRFLTRPGTTLEIRQLGDTFHYYLYIVRT